ncbi:hypothetical protein KI387_002624, partial [Taxus chinensis]
MGLSLEGIRFFNKKIDKNTKVRKFIEASEELQFVTMGIKVNSIPTSFDELSKMMVRFITLE